MRLPFFSKHTIRTLMVVVFFISSLAAADGFDPTGMTDFSPPWFPPSRRDLQVRLTTPSGEPICIKLSGRFQNGNINLGPGEFHIQGPNGSTLARNKLGRSGLESAAMALRNFLIKNGLLAPGGSIYISDNQHRAPGAQGRPGYNTGHGMKIGPDGLERFPPRDPNGKPKTEPKCPEKPGPRKPKTPGNGVCKFLVLPSLYAGGLEATQFAEENDLGTWSPWRTVCSFTIIASRPVRDMCEALFPATPAY